MRNNDFGDLFLASCPSFVSALGVESDNQSGESETEEDQAETSGSRFATTRWNEGEEYCIDILGAGNSKAKSSAAVINVLLLETSGVIGSGSPPGIYVFSAHSNAVGALFRRCCKNQISFFADRQAKVCASDLGRNEFAVESRASSSISTASNPPKLEPKEKRSCRNDPRCLKQCRYSVF